MKTRITDSNLESMIDRINFKVPNANLSIGHAYGGVRLESNNGSKDISYRLTKRELYEQLITLENFLYHVGSL